MPGAKEKKKPRASACKLTKLVRRRGMGRNGLFSDREEKETRRKQGSLGGAKGGFRSKQYSSTSLETYAS